MHVAILLFEHVTALDAVGPYEVLSRLPGATLDFVGVEVGPVRTDTGRLALTVDRPIAEVDAPDIVLVPGGPGSRAALKDPRILDWLRRVHRTTRFTTSVCTGSLVLAAAGLLDGVEATTYWACMDELAALGAVPVRERVVERGRIVTAAGVSSGIDMALTLAARIGGDALGQALQLGIEYDPAPPFDCGNPARAPKEIVEMVAALI
ncbi:MAG: DJ-1/PfpI family protein [Alphaproteobacteria bacterium]|nr:DJ-1/PfpI family protein [Alphaproteobacteria bacterium]